MKPRFDKKPVLIVNSKTGKVSYGESHLSIKHRAMSESSITPPDRSEPLPQSDHKLAPTGDAMPTVAASTVSEPPGSEPGPASAAVGFAEPAAAVPAAKELEPGKAKPDIETLEQFIAYVYGRKGQRVALKPKVMRAIAVDPRLDDAARTRLLALADADLLLAVPRQLLLISREIDGYASLRAALASFAMLVMTRHPAFALLGPEITGSDLPETYAMSDALSAVMAYEPVPAEPSGKSKEASKPQDLVSLRHNAAHLLVTWWSCQHGLSLDRLTSLLLQSVWAPAARELADDHVRLRALTEVEQPAALGWVSQRLRQQASDARSAQQRAERAAETLRARVAELEIQLATAATELDVRAATLEATRSSSAQVLAQVREQHHAERVHLQHDLEQLRGRLTRRLDDSVAMLEVGLTALHNKTPRMEVMTERAEHVIDALRTELGNLRNK